MSSSKRAILFRFHKEFEICRNHLEILRTYNPGIPIHGLYGGTQKDEAAARKLPLDSFFMIPLEDPYWKWLHGDLAIRWWFKEVGRRYQFDLLHVFEWDMVLLESIVERYRQITDGVAITGRKPLKQVFDTWYWVAEKRGRAEWDALLERVKKNYSYRKQPWCGIFGGVILSRTFIERYAKEDVWSLCNDEVRVPLYAQAYGLPVHDTGLRGEWFSTDDKTFTPSQIVKAYAAGQTAFHPVRMKLDVKKLLKWRERKS